MATGSHRNSRDFHRSNSDTAQTSRYGAFALPLAEQAVKAGATRIQSVPNGRTDSEDDGKATLLILFAGGNRQQHVMANHRVVVDANVRLAGNLLSSRDERRNVVNFYCVSIDITTTAF